LGRLNQLYNRWRDRLDFYCVYIQEAHPEGGWQVEHNLTEGVIYEQPETMDQRASIAKTCVLRTGFEMPLLLDSMDNDIDRRFAALPERLYLLDERGVVVWKSVMGSGGFDAEAFGRAIAERVGGEQ
jgi:type I thyroxine 5'-deiodinase